MAYLTPLRYPGGKRDLANFMKLVYIQNSLAGAPYIEPYAGGAGIAFALLLGQFTREIHLNDFDRSIYAFWYSVKYQAEELCDLIQNVQVTVMEWDRQREIQHQENVDLLTLGFSTFFLNRTNRSGILSGGIIGGRDQQGTYLIDARFNRGDLIHRIRRIARYRENIHVYNQDAAQFIQNVLPGLSENTLVYLDPPYYVKGQMLYRNFYGHDDHVNIGNLVAAIRQHWIVTYDNAPAIQTIYGQHRQLTYNLNYSANNRTEGSEVMFFSDNLLLPTVMSPVCIPENQVHQQLI